MGSQSDLEASPPALSGDLTSAGALLLDTGTNLQVLPGQKGWMISAYSTCDEASVVPFGVGGGSARARRFRPADLIEDSRGRQAKTTVRRICRHQSLAQLVTLTYSEVPSYSAVSRHLDYFWESWKVVTRRPRPHYVAVCEWGNLHGRLHVHIGVDWWDELNCTEVCEKCDRYGVIAKTRRDLRGDELCIGCLWGRGFVGRPEQNADGRGMSGYLAKYLAKDLAAVHHDPHSGKKLVVGVPFGGKRYRASLGAKPTPLRVWTPSLEVAREVAFEVVGRGRDASYVWRSNDVEDSRVSDVEFFDFRERVVNV